MRLDKLFATNVKLINNLTQTGQLLRNNVNKTPILIKQIRHYSEETKDTKPFALFENRPTYMLPNPFKVLFQNLKIKWEMGRIDPNFKLVDFYLGTQMALVTVANKISTGNFDNLNEMVQEGFVEKIKNKYPRLTDEEKAFLAIKQTDIFSQNITDFNVHTSSSNGNIIVQIKMQFVLMNNADEVKKSFLSFYNLSFKDLLDKNIRTVTLADYGFTRDFSQDTEGKWLIFELNHYNWEHISKSFKE